MSARFHSTCRLDDCNVSWIERWGPKGPRMMRRYRRPRPAGTRFDSIAGLTTRGERVVNASRAQYTRYMRGGVGIVVHERSHSPVPLAINRREGTVQCTTPISSCPLPPFLSNMLESPPPCISSSFSAAATAPLASLSPPMHWSPRCAENAGDGRDPWSRSMTSFASAGRVRY